MSQSQSQPLNPLAPPFPANSPEYLKQIVQSDFANMINGDQKALANIVELNLFLLNKIEEYEARIISNESYSLYAKRISVLEYDIRMLNEENTLLKQKLAQNEDATHLMYLRIEGLPEARNENILTNVATTLSRTGTQCNASDIDYARRIGKFKSGSIRPIMVRFFSEAKRNSILYNRANLNKNAEKLIWINDEVSDLTRRKRKITRDVATLAKQQGIEGVRVHGDGVVIGSHKYKHCDLDLLPEELSVGKAKTREEEEDVYFQSEDSFLSNFFPCKITDPDGSVYNCAEQAYQHKKAVACGSPQTADKIFKQRDPYEIKRLGKQVSSNSEWLSQEESIMSAILTEKFKQNDNLCALLVDTDNKRLHEASNDNKWAMGAELSSKAVASGTWSGADLMGRLLEGIRASFMGDDIHSDIPPLEGDDDDQVIDDFSPMPDGEGDNTVTSNTSVLINTSTPSHSSIAVPSPAQPQAPPTPSAPLQVPTPSKVPITTITTSTSTISASAQVPTSSKVPPTTVTTSTGTISATAAIPPRRPPPPARPPATQQPMASSPGDQQAGKAGALPVTRSKAQDQASSIPSKNAPPPPPTRPSRNKTNRSKDK